MARLNARAGIYSGGYEQLLALRAKPNKGDATLRDIRALEEIHANTIRQREGGAAATAPDSMSLMVGGGAQLKSIIHDGSEISVEEMGRLIADHKDATDTMRARIAAAKKAGIPSFAPPTAGEVSTTGGEPKPTGTTPVIKTMIGGKPVEIKGEDWHAITQDELFKRFNSSMEKGLDQEELVKKQQEFGPNLLTPPPTTPFWLKTLINLVGGFQLMLWGGALLSFIVYGYVTISHHTTLPHNVHLTYVVW
jgi:magnesium-transporting ATPase (P-type)